MIQMLELSDKEFKIRSMILRALMEKVEKVDNLQGHVANVSREMEILAKNQMRAINKQLL